MNSRHLFLSSSDLSSSVCVRESLNCNNPVELSYFSASLMNFTPVCYWCGSPEETLIRHEHYVELERNYLLCVNKRES